MKKNFVLFGSCALALALVGCPGSTETPDTGSADGGVLPDGGDSGHDGGRDSGPTIDMGVDGGGPIDANVSDAGSDSAIDGGSDAGPVTDFRIDSLSATGCTTIDVDTAIGDDHGGIAIATDRVLLDGDGNGPTSNTGIFPLDLAPAAPPPLVAARDNFVSDLATGTLYMLQDAAGPLGYDGESLATTLTSLVVANDDLSAGTTTVTLSTPIAIDFGTGIFAGSGEIGIHDGSHLWIITLATGAVQDAGVLTVDHQDCETWAYWGVLEHVGTAHALVVGAGGAAGVHRIDVATGTVTDLGGITDAGDMCSLSLSTATHRWYFHSETTTSFSTNEETIGYCDATFDTTGGNLQITALASTGCMSMEVDGSIGDDHGGIAVTSGFAFLTGDAGSGRWALDLTGGAFSSATYPVVGPALDGIVSNIHGGTAWSLATATDLFDVETGGDMTRLVQIDDTGTPTTTVIALSQTIALTDIETFGGPVGLFAGWDEIAIYDGQADPHVWLIALPSGTVTDLGAMAALPVQTSETWAFWGVVEHFGGAHYLVAHSDSGTDPTISRFLVPSGTETVITTFTDISDLASLTIGPTYDRWYFHHEGNSELTGTNDPEETLGFCAATVTHP